jgi:hypothetical protein
MESFNNIPPQEKPEEEKDKPFSEEGLLNRNFGKDVEKPSEADFYRNGILNRPKFQENLRKQREGKEGEKIEGNES